MSFYFCHGGSSNGFKLSDSSAVSESEKNAIDQPPRCPECLSITSQHELDVFGGLCEECSGVFD